MKKKILFLIFFLFFKISFAEDFFTIKDLTGREVYIPKKIEKIICLGPGTLRLISYLQATDLVVGIEELEIKHPKGRPYWLAQKKLQNLPIVAPGGVSFINRMPDLEKILKLRPDIIFVTLLQKEKAREFQEKINIPVVVLSYGMFPSFDETIFSSLKLLGRILKKNTRVKEIISFIKDIKKSLKEKIKNVKERPSAYIGGIGFKGMHGIESTDSSYKPFEWLNVNNLAKKIKKSGQHFVSKEKLLFLNPDYIFIDAVGKKLFLSDHGRKKKFYDQFLAFRNKKVFLLFPFNWYTTNIGTALINVYAVAKVLYPKEFKNIDLSEKGKEIYIKLLGVNVFPVMEKHYGSIGAYYFLRGR